MTKEYLIECRLIRPVSELDKGISKEGYMNFLEGLHLQMHQVMSRAVAEDKILVREIVLTGTITLTGPLYEDPKQGG